MILGAIEAGGTKFVCGIGNQNGEILERITIPTTTPAETLKQVIEFFQGKQIDALGVGSFGPVDLNPVSPTYGFITSTPKKNWNSFNLIGELKKHINVPIGFDTDVNAAALGEMEWGAANGLDSCLYMTVGTGVGVGAIAEGRLIHGMLHPEMGHILVRRHEDDSFQGCCPYHGDCLEGMAAGPAIESRWGQKGSELESNPKVWELEAYYLAQALVNYILILSPKRLILGGGVMKQEHLFPLIRENVAKLLNGYIKHENIFGKIDEYIVPPVLGDNAGLCGALALAKRL
ncbi:ROK family protein [Fictibacillus barbaricus]|uniref:fructokinase n=1 Tax=Fictibacillus barbaricus TaxID=182136 RepID=A0ABU1U1C9_9BACL|nr:ROK family protein [Fictibacillus barbaricus]MDR7073235.1 fructokinase [Fictibacillus barbaricus]